jgi:DNA-binding PadR family transcriptional regulator
MTAMDVILGLLHKRPFSGYEIKHTFHTLFTLFFNASYGTIYPTLSKMEKLGYITKKTIPQDNRPVKNVFTLTDKGREQFKDYLQSPLEDEVYRSDFLVRLYFGEHLDPAAAIQWMEKMLKDDKSNLSVLEEKKTQYWELMNPTQQIGLSMGIEQLKTRIRVLKEGLGRLEALSS